MKIRNHRKYTWLFIPHKNSILDIRFKKFKFKRDLINFLNKNFDECLGGTIHYNCDSFDFSGTVREWFVWYNDYDLRGAKLKIELRQNYFRNKKFISKPHKIEKDSKKYFAFSDKICWLMANIYESDDSTISPNKAKKLMELFRKRGFVDFELDEENWNYVEYYLKNGIPFNHWSDRCNFLRCKTIFEYFKSKNLI